MSKELCGCSFLHTLQVYDVRQNDISYFYCLHCQYFSPPSFFLVLTISSPLHCWSISKIILFRAFHAYFIELSSGKLIFIGISVCLLLLLKEFYHSQFETLRGYFYVFLSLFKFSCFNFTHICKNFNHFLNWKIIFERLKCHFLSLVFILKLI